MGLFKSNKKQTEKDKERQQWEEIHSPEAIAARNQEKAQIASMFDGERTLIWGESMVLNMMVQDFTCKAENVVTFVSKEPEKLLEKCKEFQPTILVLTGEPENLPEFLKQIAPGCPDAAIIISSSKPELLPYSKSELEAAHVCAVLKKPFGREDFLGAIQNIRDNK